jgi:hypothetical protein
MQVDTAIEPVGDRAQVALGVLAEVEGVIRTAQAALHIAEDRIDPLQHGDLFGLAPPTMTGSWKHPASVTPAKQARPSETAVVPGQSASPAQAAIA